MTRWSPARTIEQSRDSLARAFSEFEALILESWEV